MGIGLSCPVQLPRCGKTYPLPRFSSSLSSDYLALEDLVERATYSVVSLSYQISKSNQDYIFGLAMTTIYGTFLKEK